MNQRSEIGAAARRKQQRDNPNPLGIEAAAPTPPTPAEAVEQVTAKRGPGNDGTGANGMPAEFEFDLNYTDARGYVWTGHFKAHVLTIRERARVGLTRAQLAGGINPAALDVTTQSILEMQAHLAVAINDAPGWAKDLQDFRDTGVLAAIYDIVARYEEDFWRPRPRGAGSGNGEAASPAP